MKGGVFLHPLAILSGWKEKRLFLPASALLFFALFFLLPLLFPHSGFAAQVTLAWDANTEVPLAGYKIYYKTSTPGAPYDGAGANEGDSPIEVPLALLTDKDNPEYTLTGLSDTKTYYFVVTAYNSDKRESGYSGEVSTGSTTTEASTGGSGGDGSTSPGDPGSPGWNAEGSGIIANLFGSTIEVLNSILWGNYP